MVQKSNSRSIPGRRPPRARRYDARRDGILRAAARIFRQRGFSDTGMRDIAVATDLSPANLYHYFKGKDEILFYCQDRALDRMLTGVAQARRAMKPADQRLLAVLTTHVLTMLDEVEGATAHLQDDHRRHRLRHVRRRGCGAPDAGHAGRAQLGGDLVSPRRPPRAAADCRRDGELPGTRVEETLIS
jgi:AcrR family transcriptional regulator